MSDTEKTCPHCGKKLRIDNTRGACSACLAAGKSPGASEDDSSRGKTKGRSDVLKRFRIIAHALGKDPDAILEEAAQAWLDTIAKAIE